MSRWLFFDPSEPTLPIYEMTEKVFREIPREEGEQIQANLEAKRRNNARIQNARQADSEPR
jgi:hypothetical protein